MAEKEIKINTIYNENCIDTMKRMPDNFIDLVVTSPPYDNLRIYETECEWNFDIFKQIANKLHSIIKDGGIMVWIVGDGVIGGTETGTSFKQALYFKDVGFNLHDTMIYQKNTFSFPSRNRYHQIFEYMFILTKGTPKTFNPIKDRKNKYAGRTSGWGKNTIRQQNGSLKEITNKLIINEYDMRPNIWRYVISYGFIGDIIANEHPAIFSEKLAEDHIKSWSNEKDLVYDPFMGSGTVAKMCILSNRNYIGSEISNVYCKLAEKRIAKIKYYVPNHESWW